MLRKIKTEWKHITWPKTRDTAKRFTMVVLGSAVICGLIWIVDTITNALLGLII